MVLFILTRDGYSDVSSLIPGNSVWTNLDVLTKDEVADLRSQGVDLTTFTYPIDPQDLDEIAKALAVIALHHPRQRIWVEHNRPMESDGGDPYLLCLPPARPSAAHLIDHQLTLGGGQLSVGERSPQ